MPSYQGHIVGGSVAYALLYSFIRLTSIITFSLPEQILLVGFTLLGALFPDIDVYSKMQQILFKSLLLLLPCALFMQHLNGFIFLCAATAVCITVQHRTVTHNLFFIIFFSVSSCMFAYYQRPELINFITIAGIHFFIGAFSHLVLDRGFKGALLSRYLGKPKKTNR